ncbi:MAG TPA: hypothetical protein VLA61_04565 [Ideonella sp.]|uniref:hypothetical protein n=1 Tax=Ideonella sp. TaxID=1929293 RepID=UPI002C41D1D7|nr:hypothetical protein [Ideonella sp.]HSI47514.1 hypothetical protein [Ideonella sp.]
MVNALFAFPDAAAGRLAAQQLVERGLPASAVRLHLGQDPIDPPLPRQVDEQVTGGLISNVLDLFQGIFDWGASPHDAAPYEETVRRGGAVISVDASTAEQQADADRLLTEAGCLQRTDWRVAPGN